MLRDSHISTVWSPDLAYVIGLITSDGNLANDVRHINLTSKDESIVLQTRAVLGIRNKIGMKSRSKDAEKKYYFLQFGSVDFYRFLLEIGLTPNKSKTLPDLKIPKKYFADFLRGCIDGDGSIREIAHPESKHLQLRVSLASASVPFLKWIHESIRIQFNIEGGWINTSTGSRCSSLSFGKADSIIILKEIYSNRNMYRLERKFLIAKKYLDESYIV